MKTCRKCGKTKPLEAFHRDRKGKDGRQSWCRDCKAALRSAKRERKECLRCPNPAAPGKALCPEHLEKRRQYDNKRHAERRSLGLCILCPAERVRPAVVAGCCEKCYARHRDNWNRRSRERGHPGRRRREAAKLGGPSDSYTREQVWSKTDGLCHLCGGELGDKWHVDHAIPLASGYVYDVLENVWPAHPSCNIRKKDRTTVASISAAYDVLERFDDRELAENIYEIELGYFGWNV